MKLKTILTLIQESSGFGMAGGSLGGSLTSHDIQLRPYPGSMDDVESWDGITEHGSEWFCYRETNNWDTKRSGASIHITEGDPHKYWIKIKTHGLRKPNDTNESYRQRVKKHSDKVAGAWMSAARKLHNNPDINEVGNPIQMSWNEAFKLALADAKVKPFIAEWGESVKKKEPAMVDPVNFTFRLQENTETPPYIIFFVQYWQTDNSGVEEEVVQDFSNKDDANKLVIELARKNAKYELFIKLLGDKKIYDSRDQKGHEHIGLNYINGKPVEKFRDTPLTENTEPSNISYSAIVLDNQYKEKLLKLFGNKIPANWEKIAHHMTITMGALPDDKKKDIGKHVNIMATELGFSDKAIAVKVTGYPTTNKFAHVTLAVNRIGGGKPKDSNDIVTWEKIHQPIPLWGKVTEMPIGSKV